MIEKYSLLAAKIFIALVMLVGGSAKLTAVPDSFGIMGFPDWFGHFIGVCEIVGAIAIFIRPFSALAALSIAFIMCGAVYFHISYTPIVKATPAIVILLLTAFVFIKTKSQILNFSNT